MTIANVTAEEHEQIRQTIEMFEVIAQANPNDCQSLEILKDAHWKLGQQTEALLIARRLAATYFEQGQYSSALLEYEGILQREPDSPEILAALGEVEARLQQGGNESEHRLLGLDPEHIGMDFGALGGAGEATLITTNATQQIDLGLPKQDFGLHAGNDGNEQLAKFLTQHRLATEDVVQSALERVQKANQHLAGQALASSLIDEVSKSKTVDLETLLSGILDRTKFAYIPLDYYDLDRQIIKMLPESLTLGRLIVPFDIISRTLMVAMANPFDAAGKEAVQQLVDYNIQWHLAAPGAIAKALNDAYRLDSGIDV